jgi:hypothetical protein
MGVSQKMKHEQFWDVWDVWPPDLGPAHARRNEWPPLQGNFQHVEKQSHLFPQKNTFGGFMVPYILLLPFQTIPKLPELDDWNIYTTGPPCKYR